MVKKRTNLTKFQGCVAKSEGDGRLGKLHCYRSASRVYSSYIQVASFPGRDHPPQRAMVLPICALLPGFRGDNAGTGSSSRPLNH